MRTRKEILDQMEGLAKELAVTLKAEVVDIEADPNANEHAGVHGKGDDRFEIKWTNEFDPSISVTENGVSVNEGMCAGWVIWSYPDRMECAPSRLFKTSKEALEAGKAGNWDE
jgi:hypothetical protein